MAVLLTIAALSLVVAIHEFGHFSAAKKFGISCPIFSIGFGPRIIGFKWGETDFRFSLLLLGGYVRMKGFMSDKEEGGSDSHASKTRLQRFLVAAAGPFANFFSAFVCATLVFALIGIPTGTNTVAKINISNPEYAKEPSIQAEDKIISVNGTPTKNANEVGDNLQLIIDQPKKLIIIRDGSQKEIVLDPGRNIQISFVPENKKLGLLDSAQLSWRQISSIVALQISAIGDILKNESGAAKNISGPVGIINIGSQINEQLGWLAGSAIFAFLISIALGFMNLLPIPVLDGGYMLILGLEMVMGRDIGQSFKNALLTFGIIILVSILLLATFNDLIR